MLKVDLGSNSKDYIKKNNKITITVEPRSFQFLMQRLSVAIQRGNAACIIGTVPSSAGWDELFYI